MRKIILGALATLFLVGSAFGVQAAPRDEPGPGPNGSNDHGLCTAYFNGQKKGHTEGEGPGPFGVLEDEATDSGDNEDKAPEQQVSDDVFEYCNGIPKGIGGNPEENGRFDCRTDEEKDGPVRDGDGDGEIECIAND